MSLLGARARGAGGFCIDMHGVIAGESGPVLMSALRSVLGGGGAPGHVSRSAGTRCDRDRNRGKSADPLALEHLGVSHGIQVAHGTLVDVGSPHALDLMAERVIPAVDKF